MMNCNFINLAFVKVLLDLVKKYKYGLIFFLLVCFKIASPPHVSNCLKI